MKLPIVLRDEAQAEFDEAFDWYDAQRVGLGPEFADEIQKVFDRIAVHPPMHWAVLNIRKAALLASTACTTGPTQDRAEASRCPSQ